MRVGENKKEWYATQMSIICTWLGERLDHSLHDVQLIALTNIMPKIYADMSLQGVSEEKLNLKTYQTIMSRLKMEEAAASAGGGLFEQPQTSIFTTSILSSLTSSGSGGSTGGGPTSSIAASCTLNSSSQMTPTASAASTQANAASGIGTPPLSSNMMTTALAGATGGCANIASFAVGSMNAPLRQPPMQKLDSLSSSSSGGTGTSIQSRRFPPLGSMGLNSPMTSAGGNAAFDNSAVQDNQHQQQEGDNIADRALQGATRMFKGFWSN